MTPPANVSSRSRGNIVALIGAIISLAFFIVASLHRPPFLQILIGGWVLSPFVAYAGATRLVPAARRALDAAVILATLLSMVVYAYAAFGSPTWKAAAPFVMVPLVSLGLLLFAAVGGALIKPPTR